MRTHAWNEATKTDNGGDADATFHEVRREESAAREERSSILHTGCRTVTKRKYILASWSHLLRARRVLSAIHTREEGIIIQVYIL